MPELFIATKLKVEMGPILSEDSETEIDLSSFQFAVAITEQPFNFI